MATIKKNPTPPSTPALDAAYAALEAAEDAEQLFQRQAWELEGIAANMKADADRAARDTTVDLDAAARIRLDADQAHHAHRVAVERHAVVVREVESKQVSIDAAYAAARRDPTWRAAMADYLDAASASAAADLLAAADTIEAQGRALRNGGGAAAWFNALHPACRPGGEPVPDWPMSLSPTDIASMLRRAVQAQQAHTASHTDRMRATVPRDLQAEMDAALDAAHTSGNPNGNTLV